MRAVVVHPQPMSGKVLQFLLNEVGHDEVVLVGTASDGLQAVVGQEIDLVILEMNLPDLDGLELCRELRAHKYSGPIIMLSMRPDNTTMRKALEAGADDFMVEPIAPHELLAKVAALARRYQRPPKQIQPNETSIVVEDVELSLTQLTFHRRGEHPIRLTPTEAKLLECLMRRPGIAVSRDTLIAQVWGYELASESNRVDVYMRRLRHKIEKDPTRPQFIHTVRLVGYLFRVGDQRRNSTNKPGNNAV